MGFLFLFRLFCFHGVYVLVGVLKFLYCQYKGDLGLFHFSICRLNFTHLSSMFWCTTSEVFSFILSIWILWEILMWWMRIFSLSVLIVVVFISKNYHGIYFYNYYYRSVVRTVLWATIRIISITISWTISTAVVWRNSWAVIWIDSFQRAITSFTFWSRVIISMLINLAVSSATSIFWTFLWIWSTWGSSAKTFRLRGLWSVLTIAIREGFLWAIITSNVFVR